MQTLSLQTSQSAQKSLTDVANKSEANVDALASSSEKTPFQHELTKQVHAKKQSSQSVQARATLPQNKVAQGTRSPKNVQSKMDAEAMANALATEKQPVDIAKLSPADSVAMLLTLQPADKVSDAGSLRESKGKKETEAEALAAINLENNVAALAGAQMMPAPVAPMFKYQNDAAALPEEQLAAASGDLNSPLTSVMPTAPQKSLDLILSNNLSQSKNLSAPVMEPDVADNMVAKLPLQTGRAEDVLGNMASKGTGVEVVANKLSSSVLNEAANKEMLTNKEAVTMQTAAIQSSIVSASSQSPVMQAANNLAAAQQLGRTPLMPLMPFK